MDLCVDIQQQFMKLQTEIDQSIYSNEYTFLKNNLQIINQIQYEKMRDILADASITNDISRSYYGTLTQLYKDGIIIQKIVKPQNNNNQPLGEGKISYSM